MKNLKRKSGTRLFFRYKHDTQTEAGTLTMMVEVIICQRERSIAELTL